MVTKTEATIEDLIHAPDDAMYELIDGKLVRISPTGFSPNLVAGEIYVALRAYAGSTGSGYAMTDGIAYIVNLLHRRSFSPDASFTRSTPENRMRFVDGAPVFAAEVRSEGDYGNAANRAYHAKRNALSISRRTRSSSGTLIRLPARFRPIVPIIPTYRLSLRWNRSRTPSLHCPVGAFP